MPKARRFLNKLGVKLIAVALILLGVFFTLDLSFRPVVETVNAYQCHETVTRVINEAILSELESGGVDYESLVTLSRNGDGEVVSVESNIVNINRLKTEVAERIEREIERMSAINIEIPIGTLLGIQLLHGRGFNVGMSVKPFGYTTTSIISEFSEAGINQTLHRIVIEINTNVDAVIPAYRLGCPSRPRLSRRRPSSSAEYPTLILTL